MKTIKYKLKILFCSLIACMSFGQVIIGDDVGTATDKTSVLLEFSQENKGIIVPYVRSLPTQEGAIVLDATDPANAKVKYYNGAWVDLSQDGAIVTTVGDPLNTKDIIDGVMAIQPTIAEVTDGDGAIIGADTTNVDGALVLESSNKAMVLPTVNSTDDIPSPSPGMLVYLNKAGAKRLAVFNGSKWTYWAATP